MNNELRTMNSELKTMNNELKESGFSLTEVLLAVATLAIGMLFIAGTFLAGIYLTTVAAERTTAAVVADEAFAKIKLYGINLADPNLAPVWLSRFEDVAARRPVPAEEFAYPSNQADISERQYYWSAVCRRLNPNPVSRLVQVTVFVSRRTASAALYQGGAGRPVPMRVNIFIMRGSNMLRPGGSNIEWINDGCTIVDHLTGQIYRVLQRNPNVPPLGTTIELDRPWEGSLGVSVWVVPPPIGSGKDPCIAVYQKVMRF
jgi:Tfp pilus assembly protein PilV